MNRIAVVLLAAAFAMGAQADHRSTTADVGEWVRDLERVVEELNALEALVASSNDPGLRNQGSERIRAARRRVEARLRELRPEPPPTPAGVLFAESFDDNRQRWETGRTGLCEADVEDGELTLSSRRTPRDKNCRYWWPFNQQIDGFRAEFDVRYERGPENYGYGLVIKAVERHGQPTTYNVMVNAQGSAAIFAYDGRWQALWPWQPAQGFVRQGRTVNRVSVDASGDRISLTVNGSPVATVGAPGVSASRIGFYLDYPGLEAAFDNIALYSARPSWPSPQPAPSIPPPTMGAVPPPTGYTPAPIPPPPPPAPTQGGVPPPAGYSPPPPAPGYQPPPAASGPGASFAEMQALHGALGQVFQSNERKRIVFEFAAYRNLSTQQSIETVRTFPAQADQVEVAAGLYPAVSDPQNWYQIYSTLASPASSDQLRRWCESIDAKGKPPRRPRGRAGAPAPMNDVAFQQAQQSLNAAHSSAQKLNVLRGLAGYNFFNAGQALVLMRQMFSANDKRQAGVVLWAKLVDPENTYLLFAAAPGLQDDLARTYAPPR